MISPELIPPTEDQTDRQLYIDFLASFPHAQGNYHLQRHLSMQIASLCHTSTPEINLEAALQLIQRKLSSIKIPRKHQQFIKNANNIPVPITSSIAANESRNRFAEFTYAMRAVFGDDTQESPSEEMRLVKELFFADREIFDHTTSAALLNRDRMFIYRGRPDGSHTSFFRTHGLLGVSTKSPAIDQVYQHTAQLVLPYFETPFNQEHANEKIAELANSLKTGWELHHPGESFLPKTA